MSENQIWTGALRVVLTNDRISKDCSWAHGAHSATRIDAVNLAFARFYEGRRNIKRYGDSAHKHRMKKHFEKLADTGWGAGVETFREACDHVWENYHESFRWIPTPHMPAFPVGR